MTVRVADLVASIGERFPLVRAEPWDRNGLVAGDPAQAVTGVRLALDPTLDVIARAAGAGQNVVVTHHPVALSMPSTIVAGDGTSGVLFAALDARIALVNAHTNLDRDLVAQRRLPELLGLEPLEALETSLAAMALVTVFVPPNSAQGVIDEMAAAGAGRVGDYVGCSFSVGGVGRYTVPQAGAPAFGRPGSAEEVDEVRVEMVCSPQAVEGVVEACRRAHPYEEPLIVASSVELSRNAARLGMMSTAEPGSTLGSLAERCAEVFGRRPRVWGDAEMPASRVATTTGSGGSLLADAVARAADVLVLGEVRYHDAMAAEPLGIIELGHDVSEWPLVGVLAEAVRATPGVDPATVSVETPGYGWWTP